MVLSEDSNISSIVLVQLSGRKPYLAALFKTMMPAVRLVCQRPSSNFPYFWTPLANFMLSHPNSVEYGNYKTTTLLHSAKCTRPLFRGRTGCGGRPSGWHDIVTCQRLVYIFNAHGIMVNQNVERFLACYYV